MKLNETKSYTQQGIQQNKKVKVKQPSVIKVALLSFTALFSSQMINAQCADPTIVKREYCVNQQAEIELDDASSNVTYGWFTSTIDDIPSYGTDGEGRMFESPSIQSTSSTFYYQKEVMQDIGAAYSAPTGATDVPYDGAVPYMVAFENDVDFVLNSLTVIVPLDDPTKTYGLNIRYNDGATDVYGTWLEGQPSDFLSIGSGYYRIEIPLDITVTAGVGRTFELVSDNDGHDSVETFTWYPDTEYSGGTYADGDIRISDPTVDVDGTDLTPMLMDWDVTVLCSRTAVNTQLASVCCTPVGDAFTVTTPISNPTSTDFPVTLTASGSDIDASMYYYWYDVSGTVQASGQGVSTYDATESGQYTVRVVNAPGDESEFACYGDNSVVLGIKSIYAPDDFTVCLGDPVTLKGEGAEGDYDWYSDDPDVDDYIVTHDVQETDVYILEPGAFTFTVEGEVKLGNIAYDGKFELFDDTDNFNSAQPNRTFNTAYGIAQGNTGEYITGPGEYRVDNEIKAYSANTYWCDTDPTYWEKTDPGTGSTVSRGNIFIADALAGASQTPYTAAFGAANPLWELSNQPVAENTCYEFSLDISNWNENTAPDIMLLVNGDALPLTVTGGLGSIETGPDGAEYYAFPEADYCRWETITGEWCSGSNTTATIAVAEVANQTPGHEFAMDDITFSSGRGMQTDEVVVTVTDCNDMEARPDGTSCIGDAFPLYMTTNNGFLMDWTNSSGDVVATDESADAYPISNETYTARVKFPLINFIKNGTFEDDNSPDFSTDMALPTGSSLEQGQYTIDNGNSGLMHSSMQSGISDHTTGTTSGDMMLMRFEEDQAIIEKTIAVTSGEDYGFSAWFKHIHSGGSNSRDYPFELLIDNVVVYTFTLTSGQDWTQFGYTWSPTASGNVTVELRSTLDHHETGLAIDDVSLAQLGREATDDVDVTVSNCFDLEARADVTVCAGDPLSLFTITNDGFVSGWEDPNGDVIATTETATVYPTISGDYTVRAKFPVVSMLNGGDFESGSLPFTTGFTASGTNSSGGDYVLGYGNESSLHNSSFDKTQTDHTSGTGQMMMLHVGNGTHTILSQDVTLTAGEDYSFSAWVKHMHPHVYNGSFSNSRDHELELFIGGVSVYTYTLEQVTPWNNLSYAWTEATGGNVTIELRVTSTHNESSMAIDDISLSQLGFEDSDVVLVTVDVCNTLTVTDDCVNMEREVYHETDGVFMGWFDDSDVLLSTDDTLILNGLAADQDVTAKIGVGTAAINENGSFDDGDTGHNLSGSEQTNNQQLQPNGMYKFVTDASTIPTNNFVALADADGTGGQYMVYNTSNNGGSQPVYTSDDLAVTDGQTYNLTFSVAYASPTSVLNNVKSASSNTGELYPVELYINNTLIASYDLAEDNTWQKFDYSWIQSGSGNVEVELRIDKFNDYGSTQHLAWGIDAVYLQPVNEVLTETVTVEPCTPPCNQPTSVEITNSSSALIVCNGTDTTLNGEYVDAGETPLTGMNYVWYQQGSTPVAGDYATITGTGTVAVPDEVVTNVTADQVWVLRVEDGTAGDANCYTEDDISITVTQATAAAGDDDEYCEGTGGVTLGASGGVSYAWSPTTGLDDATIAAPSADPQATTTYTVTVTDVNGCIDTDEVEVVYHLNPTAAAGSDDEFCSGAGGVTLGASGGTSYAWSPSTGLSDDAIAAPTANPTTTTTYTVTVTDAEGCTDTDEVEITVKSLPASPTVTTPVTYCLNDVATALSATGTDLLWYTVPTGTGSAVAPTPSTSTAGTTKYYVSQTVDLCEGSTDSIEVTVNALPVPVISPTTAVCEGSTTIFTNSAHTTGSYAWTVTGTGATDDGSTTEDIEITAGTGDITISVIWTDGNSCANNPAVSQVISVDAAPPTATTGGDINVCVADPIALTGNDPSPGSGTWTIETGTSAGITIDDPTQFNSAVSGLDAGGEVLIATWEVGNGVCASTTAQMTITGTGIADPAINLSSDATGAICEGTTVEFTATPTNGGNAPLYEFFNEAGTSLQAQSSTATFSLVATQDTSIYVVLTSNSSCLSGSNEAISDTIDIIVDPLPDAAVAIAGFDVCTETATLGANVPTNGTGSWSTTSSATITTPSDATSGVTGLPVGNSTFTWTISSGVCTATSDDIVINRAGSLTSADVNAQSTSLCETSTYPVLSGTALNTTASPAETGAWTSLDGATITQTGVDATITATEMTGGNDYRFVYEISNGLCNPASTDTITLTIDQLPTVADAGSPEPICTEGYQLSGNAPIVGTGMWTADDTGVTFDDATLEDATADNIQEGVTTFTWTISNGTCTNSTSTVDITRSGSLTTPLAGIDQTICETGDVTLAGNAAGTGETGTWSTPTNGTFDDENSETAVYTPGSDDLTNGTVTLTWTMSNGVCPDATSTMDVTIEATPTATITDPAGTSKTINATSTTLTAVAPTGTDSGIWSKANAGEQGTLGTPLDATTITLSDLNTFESGSGDGTTEVCWTVSTATGACPAAETCVEVIRRDVSVPDVTGDTICVSDLPHTLIAGNPTPLTANGETATWTAVGTAPFTQTGDDLQPDMTTAGTYQYVYSIENTGLGVVNRDTITIVVDELPTTATLGIDENTCLEDYQLAGNTPTVGTAMWTATGGLTFDDASSPTAIASTLVSGDYTFTWTISNGKCAASAEDIVITKLGTITTPNPGTYSDICESTTVVALSGATPNTANAETGTWTISGPAQMVSTADLNNPTGSIDITGTGTVTVEWTIANGTCPDATLNTTFEVDEAPGIASAGNDTTICGDTDALNAMAASAGTGTWSTTGTITIDDVNDPNSDFSGLVGSANLTWTVSTGGACDDNVDEVMITAIVPTSPDVTVVASQTEACEGVDNVTFTATATDAGTTPTFVWTVDGTPQTETSSTFSSTTIADGEVVEVTVTTSETCFITETDVANTSIDVLPVPTPTIDALDQSICETSPLTLTAIHSGGTLAWNAVATGSLGNSTDSYTVSSTGGYFFTEDNGVCPVQSSNTVQITVDELPVVSISGVYELFEGDSVTIEGQASVGTISWSPAIDMVDASVETPIYTPSTGGIETLTLTATNGNCSASTSVDVTVLEPVKVPNVFSPNGDGENDEWIITGLDTYPNAIIRIYNRWGSPVHRTLNVSEAWNGLKNNSGGKLPVATYYYVIELGIINPDLNVITGTVSIIR